MTDGLKIAICVIAKNEARAIARLTRQLAGQSLLARPLAFQIVVVANGCTDETTAAARAALAEDFEGRDIQWLVHETPLGGKARSWNLAVHALLDPDSDIAIFLDADIELADDHVLEELLAELAGHPSRLAVSGYPVKNIARKGRKTLVDRFSLAISSQSPSPHSVNGSLYAARMDELRKIWLPVPTPGEDGLLSAMLHTNGFSRLPNLAAIAQMPRPTHYFEAHSIRGFFRHETRMTVGTVVNGWICEFLWSGLSDEHVGSFVRGLNERDPQWVGRLVESRTKGQKWVLPPRMLSWRLHNLRGVSAGTFLVRLPFSLAATLLNLWPALQANRVLKQRNAADFW